MSRSREREQHIAVFGGSGSGKTVLVSSFYGAMQEPQFLQGSPFDVTADDPGQGHRLHANYLGMKDSARRPEPTRFSATPYAFSVRLRGGEVTGKGASPRDVMRLVWHDYPGEWFEQDVSGADEARRRLEAFRSLLLSDVAILLVDGQRLLDNAGEEERYLKSLLSGFRTGLLRLRDQLLADGPLVRFPRIWIVALSKADLLPDVDVYRFRDLVIGKAAGDLGELRSVLATLVTDSDALALGEDFVLLSSARFEPDRIEVAERIGIDLMLPIAAVLPLQRHLKWVERKQAVGKVAEDLLRSVAPFAPALVGTAKILGRVRWVPWLAGPASMTKLADLSVDQLKRWNAEAKRKGERLKEVLTRFALDLSEGEDRRILLRSRR